MNRERVEIPALTERDCAGYIEMVSASTTEADMLRRIGIEVCDVVDDMHRFCENLKRSGDCLRYPIIEFELKISSHLIQFFGNHTQGSLVEIRRKHRPHDGSRVYSWRTNLRDLIDLATPIFEDCAALAIQGEVVGAWRESFPQIMAEFGDFKRRSLSVPMRNDQEYYIEGTPMVIIPDKRR